MAEGFRVAQSGSGRLWFPLGFKALHHPADLDEAITHTRDALKFQPEDREGPEDVQLPETYRLANLVYERFTAWRDPADLTDCAEMLYSVVNNCTNSHKEHYISKPSDLLTKLRQ